MLKRDLNFLPRDVQRRNIAYDAKYGTSLASDSSPDLHKSYYALDPPDHRRPQQSLQTTQSIPISKEQHQVLIIISVTHDLSTSDIGEL